MISWKHSFRRLSEEFEVARKKRQALDRLLGDGRISQSTHDVFNKEINEAIAEIERQQKTLLEKMAAKVVELEGQVKTLEILLANFEIRHVTGEIGEEIYQRENDLLTIGLETAKRELDEVKDAADQLAEGDLALDTETEKQIRENTDSKVEIKFLEEPHTEKEQTKSNEPAIVETVAIAETPEETERQGEAKQEA